jgi:hypothetical protein
MSKTLRAYLAAIGLDETQAMNLLQNHGVISDNCVGVEDVGNGGDAVAWLEAREGWRGAKATKTSPRAVSARNRGIVGGGSNDQGQLRRENDHE